MAKKTSHPFSDTQNADSKPYNNSIMGKDSSTTLVFVPQWNRKLASNKSAASGGGGYAFLSRITAMSSSKPGFQTERKPALIMRPENTMNNRLIHSNPVSNGLFAPDHCGVIPQASVRIRKRKSCATVSRNRRPGILLGFGSTGRREVRNEENGINSPLVAVNACKKRVEFHRQMRSDSVKPGALLPLNSRLTQDAHQLKPSTFDETDSNRYHVFSYDQVRRLDSLLQTQLCIAPRPPQWDYGLMPGIGPELMRCYSGAGPSCHSNSLPSRFSASQSPGSLDRNKCTSCVADRESATKTNTKEHVIHRHERNACIDPGFCMPIINVQLKQLIRTIRDRLLEEQIVVREIRLNGGAAGCVISLEEQDNYSDLDIIFSVDLSNSVTFTKIKSVVFSSIAQFLADTFACGNLVYSCTQPSSVSTNASQAGSNASAPSCAKTGNTAANATRTGFNMNNSSPKSSPFPTGNTLSSNFAPGDHSAAAVSMNAADMLPEVNRSSPSAAAEPNSETHSTSSPLDTNRPRTRSSHSFTSHTEAGTLPSTLPTSTRSYTTSRIAHNRRASETSVHCPGSTLTKCDSRTCGSGSANRTVTGGETNTGSSNTNAAMAMMMTFTSCFFSAPFHSLPCPQNWSRLLRDESLVKQYIQKMVRIHKPSSKTADSWSLFTLGYRTLDGGKTVDVKFVDRMQRPFEFTVDSFQIVLDSLMTFYETSRQAMDEHFYPTVVAESVAGSFVEALSHLKDRLIATPRPEEIRGGGLLKYCKLLVDGYRPSSHTDVLSMERYMCSRFFIDFPDILSQHQRLTYYLANHFDNNDATKATYLQILHEVVSHSTVCLMTHERQQTLCLIRMLLQDFLSRSEFNKTGVHLDEFFSDNWALDSIYYGTTYFPKQLYLLSNPIKTMSSGENLSSGCLLYADPLGPPTSNQNSGGTQLSTEEPIGLDKTVKKSVEQDECKQTVGTDAMANVYPGPSVIELNEDTDADKVCDSFVSKLQSTNCEESLVTDKTIDFQTMDTTASPPLTEESGNPDRMTYSRQDYPAVECPNPGDLHLVPDGCFADINSGPYVNSPPMYYIPQVVTYFPTPVKYPKETEEIDETQMNSDSYACTDGTNSKSVPHYHAGIILPRMESTGVAEMNHYVGVPCPDVQYAYSNYPCGLMDSTESIPYPPSMYCYSPDPGYLIYTNPVVQNSPTLILAYPM